MPAKSQNFNIIYADPDLVVVDKAAGLLTVATNRGETRTLLNLLDRHLSRGPGRGRRQRGVHVVHRLDRDTSGLLVFARNERVARALIAQFAAHKPEREYLAVVAGRLRENSGVRRSYLVTDKALNQKSRRGGKPGAAKGELAVTHFHVHTRYADATAVTLNLETGRRNQIRVHMAELGHPVLGDRRYLAGQAAHGAWPYKRLALHARVLGFEHPVSRQQLRFESPLPAEFKQLMRKLAKV